MTKVNMQAKMMMKIGENQVVAEDADEDDTRDEDENDDMTYDIMTVRMKATRVKTKLHQRYPNLGFFEKFWLPHASAKAVAPNAASIVPAFPSALVRRTGTVDN